MIAYKFSIQQGKAVSHEIAVARSQSEAESRLRACFQHEYGTPTITFVGTVAVETLLFLEEDQKKRYKKKPSEPKPEGEKRRQKFTF